MTQPAFLELLASYEAAVDAAQRSLDIARALAEGYRSGVFPPEVVLEAYVATFDRDSARLVELREKVERFRALVRPN